MARVLAVAAALAAALGWPAVQAGPFPAAGVLDQHLLVTWYGNPRSDRMGVLGEQTGTGRAAALRRQASAYTAVTGKGVLMAYHLVAVVATCTPGADQVWRRRETGDLIRGLLEEARANGFRLVLDVQPGRASIVEEVRALSAYLREPDVYLALDPEFDVADCEVPGRHIGQLAAAEVNEVIDHLERLIVEGGLPKKVLILHQFRLDMLPDKARIRQSGLLDIVLNMDGFGDQALKKASYRAVMAQGRLPYAGIKLFFRKDPNLFTPAEVMRLTPTPAVVVYQ